MGGVNVNGRRGAFLILFGLVYISVGLSYCTAPASAAVRHSMAWMPHWSPLWFCGLLWVAAGVVAEVCAWWPMPADRFGFMALSSVATGWTVAYFIGWAVGDADRGWVAALVYALIGAAVLVVSGMPNPVHRRGTP